MRQIILYTLVIIFTSLHISYSQGVEGQMLFVEESLVERGGQLGNITANMISWPKDVSGNDAALLRVNVGSMVVSEANKLQFKFANHCKILKIENRLKESGEIWLFIESKSNNYIEAIHPQYGVSNRYSIEEALKSNNIYDITLRNRLTTTIRVETDPRGATLLFGGETYVTPVNIEAVAYGNHRMELTATNGEKTVRTISVTENNRRFQIDMRKRKSVVFNSDPSDATIFIDDNNSGKSPVSIELPHGSYRIVAVLNSLERDTMNIVINDISKDEYILKPIKKKNFNVITTYSGKPVEANLFLNNKQLTKGRSVGSFQFSEPYGSYKLEARYNGKSKERKIKVDGNSPSQYNMIIPANNKMKWFWQKYYESLPWGVSAGYVSKQWKTEGEGTLMKTDFWGDNNKTLGGFQVGVFAQPHLFAGLGVHTGLYYEFYRSQSDYMKDNDYYDKIKEQNLYIPAHLSYQLPFSDNVALSIRGGLGISAAIYGELSTTIEDANQAPITDFYGTTGYPKRFNLSADIGLDFRIYSFMVNASYSKGLTDHKSYSEFGDYSTYQNKYSIGLSYAISTDNLEDWLYDNRDGQSIYGVTVSYISKQMITQSVNGNFQHKSNPITGEENKRLHGMRIGALIAPSIASVLGARTGLFADLYFSGLNDYMYPYDMFIELDLYIPAHLSFRIPLGDEAFIALNGGLGMDITCMAQALESGSTDEYGNSNSISLLEYYGSSGYPKMVNFAGEIGGELRLGKISLDFMYSRGITKHDIYYMDDGTELKSFYKRLAFSVNVVW